MIFFAQLDIALPVIIIESIYTLCLKKDHTFKLSVNLSHLNRFSKFVHCWKAHEICYKTYATLPTSPQACRYLSLIHI